VQPSSNHFGFLLLFTAEFNLTDEIKLAIDEAKRKYKVVTSQVDIDYILYDKLNKGYIKQNQLSPDSFMQLAFQVSCDAVIVVIVIIIIIIVIVAWFVNFIPIVRYSIRDMSYKATCDLVISLLCQCSSVEG